MAVYELCVQGVMNQDREAVVHAMMLDPLSAAVCSPAEIRSMAEDLFRAEKRYIPEWCQAPRKARGPRRGPRAKGKKRIVDGAVEVSSMAARNVAE